MLGLIAQASQDLLGAELVHQVGQTRVAGLTDAGQRCSRQSLDLGNRRRGLVHAPASTTPDGRRELAQQQRGGRAEPQRDVELLDAGTVDSGEVGDRPRDSVHAHGPAPGQPAGVDLVVEPDAWPRSVSGQLSRSSGPGACTLSRQGMSA